jgi:serine O-acetyltransferase
MITNQIKSGTTNLSSIVERLCDGHHDVEILRTLNRKNRQLPSIRSIVDSVEKIRSVLFPGYFGQTDLSADNIRYYVGAKLDQVRHSLFEQIRRGFCFECKKFDVGCPECEARAERITGEFLSHLPDIQRIVAHDVQAAYDGDPAAKSIDETIFCYPGIQAITYHRLAHALRNLKVPIIPRIIAEHAHSITGIDIHPGAQIGDSFFIDHGTGVVIGETCIIGKRVRVYQGVTLGAKSFDLDEDGNPVKGIDRHPVVEDDVVIYSGATILGRIVIGRGSIIGGNVWVTRDVAPKSIITQRSLKVERFEAGAGI